MVSCSHCKWLGEKSKVAAFLNRNSFYVVKNGRVILPNLPLAAPSLDILLNDPNFTQYIGAYNSMLLFTSMGGTIDYFVMHGHGPYPFHISG